MRGFYVAVAETQPVLVEEIVEVLGEASKRYRVQLGVLVRYTKWRRRRCIPCEAARERGLLIFVDNGAFTFLTSRELEGAPSPSTLASWRRDYARWLADNAEHYDYAALPDIPVHGKRFLPRGARLERIRLSAENQARLLQLVPSFVREKLVPVIQGYDVEEYEYSYETLESFLEETAYAMSDGYYRVLAVGSVCVRKWTARRAGLAGGEAAGTLRGFLTRFLDGCCDDARGFHFFGLHSKATRLYGAHPRFLYADSGAHGFAYVYHWRDMGCVAPNTPDCARAAVNAVLWRSVPRWLGVLHRG